MGRIAKEAGISRQAVYLHFDSRADLLLGLVEMTDRNLDIPREVARIRAIDDRRERVLETVRLSVRLEPQLEEATSVLDVARHSDPDIAAAWKDRMNQRYAGHGEVWDQAAEAGLLVDGWNAERATDVTVGLTLPCAYRAFVRERGWTLEEWEGWVLDIAESMLRPA